MDIEGPAPIRVTLWELVDAVASVTADAAEQAAVVNHILDTRFATRDPRCLESAG